MSVGRRIKLPRTRKGLWWEVSLRGFNGSATGTPVRVVLRRVSDNEKIQITPTGWAKLSPRAPWPR